MSEPLAYKSTTGRSARVDFKTAALHGPAPDGGLYVPAHLPRIMPAILRHAQEWPLTELAFEVLYPFTHGSLSDDQLEKIIRQTCDFTFPMVACPGTSAYFLELFHGPTRAFKDLGVGFLAGCLEAWGDGGEKTIILVATSGDTGAAVAQGFHNRRGTDVIILYPKGKISPVQEQEITGPGGNIHAVSVEGTFDDCQRLVRYAFSQYQNKTGVRLTSANSINVARWLPQMIFYVKAWQDAVQRDIQLRLCVPSGNYGNISAALLLHTMGMRFENILAAHNANDTIPRFLEEGQYRPGKTMPTYANAMDVSDPVNFARFQYIAREGHLPSSGFFYAGSVSDPEILNAIQEVWEHHHYLMDPHTATAWHVLRSQGLSGIIVATAHPCKFEEVVIKAVGYYPEAWKIPRLPVEVNSITLQAREEALLEILRKFW